MNECTDGIGTRVNPAPVCATPRVVASDRHGRIVEARRILLRARTQLVEADRALGIMEQGRGGGVYARTRINEARAAMIEAEAMIDQAEPLARAGDV